ncbi:Transposon TX1 uncharacterized 149 kDa protein [Vitis vinifera]|uniref:Transposon TX1 uncharacterized 149 kDa protein n=1 Tax=Vitis vinifera TaxID=29760 RepID=A0A438FSV6_VITVI|nr:Transposon TX1 uncharacterized 149 kDa protein [Vitis vinifera]
MDIGRLQLERISQQEAENLEILFSETKVHSAMMEMNGDKAPGLDGFTMVFWQSYWDLVNEEILEMFKEINEQSSFLKSLNNTFLVLIPKKGGAEDLRDFRPISLLGGLYKLLAKVLANRLKRVLAASGLRNNLAKSEIILVGVVEEIDELAAELRCRVARKGTKIRFWTDVWCTSTTLSQNFPHLFALASHRNATVEEMWDQNFGQGDWNLRFLRDFNDWELDMVGDLLYVLRVTGPLQRKT